MSTVAVPTALVVAMRIRDMPVAAVPSVRRGCCSCEQLVWVSKGTDLAAGPLPVIWCVRCAAAAGANASGEAVVL